MFREFFLVSCLLFGFSSYSITQFDTLWINALKSTAQSYYNRAWWRRQQVEAVKHEALALTTQTPVLYTIFLNRTAALKSDAPGIQMSQIYGKRQDVDDLFDD